MGIQNGDIATLSELTGRGAGVAQLPNDTKIYDTKNQVQLSASNRKNNDEATAEPTVNNDSSQGYENGSRWIFDRRSWTCVDNTVGAAVWTEGGGGSGSGVGSPSVIASFAGSDYDDDTELQAAWAVGAGDTFAVSDRPDTPAVTRTLKTTTPISGSSSILITFPDGSSNNHDWVRSPTVNVPIAGRGTTTLLSFEQLNNIDTAIPNGGGEITFVVRDLTNNQNLYSVPFNKDEKFQSILYYVPENTQQIAFGLFNDNSVDSILLQADLTIELNNFIVDYRGLPQASFTNKVSSKITGFTSRMSNVVQFANVIDDSSGFFTVQNNRITFDRDIDNVIINASLYSGSGTKLVRLYNSSDTIVREVTDTGPSTSTNVSLMMVENVKVGWYVNCHSAVDLSDDNTRTFLEVSANVVSDAYAVSSSGVENMFSANISNPSGTAAIVTQSSPDTPAIASVNRTSIGYVDIVFTSGFFNKIPSVQVTQNDNIRLATVTNITSSGCTVRTFDDAGFDVDRNFSIFLQNQGSDYKKPTAYALHQNNVKSDVERQVGFWFGEEYFEKSYQLSNLTNGQNVDASITTSTVECRDGWTSSSSGNQRKMLFYISSSDNAYLELTSSGLTYNYSGSNNNSFNDSVRYTKV